MQLGVWGAHPRVI